MLKGRDIVLISSIDWNFLWQVPQEIALRLARGGNRVLFVENTGVRMPLPGDMGRVRTRLRRWMEGRRTQGIPEVAPGVYLCSPIVLPPFGPAWRREINRRLFLPRIVRAAERLRMRDPLIWTFLPTDSAYEIIRRLRTERGLVIYYCAADFSLLTPYPDSLKRSERTILEQCDLVFTTCDELTRHCGAAGRNVHTCPHGVDLSAFAPVTEAAGDDAISPALTKYRRLLASLPRPIVGYVGGLHHFVDFDLLGRLARSRPEWSWVFVGPVQASTEAISSLPNVHMLGQQPHGELARYIETFEVGIVPYVKSPHTRTVVPVKINEYLAAGRPVVSTDLAAVLDFNRKHGVLYTAENQPAPFLQAVERALSTSRDPVMSDRRRAVAAQYDWPVRIELMSSLIEARLRA
jgi:glycosyltransferase involved in cell wall biosynthesis